MRSIVTRRTRAAPLADVARPLVAEGVDQQVQLRAARRLDEDDVAAAGQRSRSAACAAAWSGTTHEPLGRQARAAARRPRCRAPRRRRRSAGRRARRPSRRPRDGPASVRLAELVHLAQDRDVAAGQAREQLQRGPHGARRRVVAVVEDRDRARRDQLAAVGRRCVAERGRARCRRGCSPRRSRPPPRPARCGPRGARASGSRPSRAPARRHEVERHARRARATRSARRGRRRRSPKP